MFQRFVVMDEYLSKRGTPTTSDLGRHNVTENETDKFVFKVPSLRNVALTAPYFHDGSAQDARGGGDGHDSISAGSARTGRR